jgi:hypothetical protein
MKFTANDRQYEIDDMGVINQTDHKPFKYNEDYAAIYDRPEYTRQSEILQAMRLGFACAAHGRVIQSLSDCGYGNGAFIKFAKQYIPYVYGFDVTGVPVEGCYIVPELVKSDVLCFHDTLEHIADLSFLKDLPHETIIISLPFCHLLTEGVAWFENKYKHFKPDEHLHHFSPLSLANLMNKYGWKEIARSTHEDVIRKSAHGLPNILSMAFKRKTQIK